MFNTWKYENRTEAELIGQVLMFSNAVVRDKGEKDKICGELQELYDLTRSFEKLIFPLGGTTYNGVIAANITSKKTEVALIVLDYVGAIQQHQIELAYVQLLTLSNLYKLPKP